MSAQALKYDHALGHPSGPSAERVDSWFDRLPGDSDAWAADRLAACRLVHTMVMSGYMLPSTVMERIDEMPFDARTVQALRDYAEAEFLALERVQHTWPDHTDCDRLDKAFEELNKQGICAVANAGTRCADGFLHVVETVAAAPAGSYRGYCYYHLEDIAWCISGRSLMVSFGSLESVAENDAAIGLEIQQHLRNAGFAAHCAGNGDPIWLSGFEWRKRFKQEPVGSPSSFPSV